jgi:hypothetical protein
VSARDEVADVAGALNDVQGSALALAVEQAALRRNIAESYVNLGRRNQNLLSRLLDAVGDLERTEEDAARLEQLYKLDHLATRIRRNAESLLVLSDGETPTRWQPPCRCPTSCGRRSVRSRTTSGCSCAPSSRSWWWAGRRPTWPTCWPSWSRTACATRRHASWSRSPARPRPTATRWRSSTTASA